MGWAKKIMMDLEERGDWPNRLEQKYVCTHHFEDPYLKKILLRYGEDKEHTCSYCGRKGKVCSMQNLMEQVSWKIHIIIIHVNLP